MRLPDKSAAALTWLGTFLLVPGLLIQSPAGRYFFAALAGLVALVPLIFGGPRRRLFAGIVAGISLLLVIATYPEFSKEQDSYRERVRQKSMAPATK